MKDSEIDSCISYSSEESSDHTVTMTSQEDSV